MSLYTIFLISKEKLRYQIFHIFIIYEFFHQFQKSMFFSKILLTFAITCSSYNFYLNLDVFILLN